MFVNYIKKYKNMQLTFGGPSEHTSGSGSPLPCSEGPVVPISVGVLYKTGATDKTADTSSITANTRTITVDTRSITVDTRSITVDTRSITADSRYPIKHSRH